MRICLVTHQFLPDNMAGVEVYVHRMARAMGEAGHDVLVYSTRKDLTRPEGQILDDEWEGVRVRRVVRNLFHEDFTRTFRDEVAESAFARAVLGDFRPDLVHIHHLIHHSLALPRLAREAGLPVVMTLHDYWLECPRMGRLLRWDGGICETVDRTRCARCLQTFEWRNPPRLKFVATSLRGFRSATGLDVQRPLQKFFRTIRPKRTDGGAPAFNGELLAGIEARAEEVRHRLLPAVDRFLCPSRFLRDRMCAFGIPADRLYHHPYGIPRPSCVVRVPGDGPIRFAYCGSVLPHKGVHVLLDAVALLRHEHRDADMRLSIHGGWSSDPAYGERIRSRGAELDVPVTGSYHPAEIDVLLGRADVQIVPSLWFENQPTTILDARVRGIPSIVSDLGGMTELVRDPALRFRPGDAQDLGRAMIDFVAQGPGEEECMPPTCEEDLETTLKHYAAIVR